MTILKDKISRGPNRMLSHQPYKLTLRSNVNLVSGPWMWAVLRLMVIHPCVKYNMPMSKQTEVTDQIHRHVKNPLSLTLMSMLYRDHESALHIVSWWYRLVFLKWLVNVKAKKSSAPNTNLHRQTDRQTDRGTDKQTDRQTDGQTDGQRRTDRQTVWLTGRRISICFLILDYRRYHNRNFSSYPPYYRIIMLRTPFLWCLLEIFSDNFLTIGL